MNDIPEYVIPVREKELTEEEETWLQEQGAFKLVRCGDCRHRGNPMKCLVAKFAKEKDVPYFFVDNHGKWFCGDGERLERYLRGKDDGDDR